MQPDGVEEANESKQEQHNGLQQLPKMLSPTLINELREAFSLFDKDGDGSITSSELLTVMQSLGQSVTDDDTKKMILRVDADKNGLIDFDEFLKMMENRAQKQSQDAEMRALFTAFDKDHSGFIDKAELKNTMKEVGFELSDKDVENMMKVAGVALKDRIFYEDFVKMMTGKIAGQNQDLSSATEVEALETLGYKEEDPASQDLRVAFSMFDKDGDGQITCSEVFDTMNSLGIKTSIKQVKRMVKRVDSDGDGTISFEEFEQLMKRNDKESSDAIEPGVDLMETFEIFDKDKDGFLNACDLKSTMEQLGMVLTDSDIHDMMKSVNVGPNGKISYTDFCKIFCFGEKHLADVQSSQQDAKNVTKQQKEGLQAVFSLFDKDGDGFITMEEVGKVLVSMGISPSEEYIKEIFQQVDLDGNGQIDFEEFLLLAKYYEKPLSEEQEIREMFDLIDKDRSGYIDIEELKETFISLGIPLNDKDIKQMLKEAKVEGTRLFYEDFVQIMMSNIGSSQKNLNMINDDCQLSIEPLSHSAPLDVDRSDLKDLRIQFAQFDKDGDGSITGEELSQVMTSLGLKINQEKVDKIMKNVDLDGNGKIDFREFCSVMKQYQSQEQSNASMRERENRQLFKVFDKNRDGYIDEEELRLTMKDLGMSLADDDVEAMMKKAGCKIPGRIYYEEFLRIMFGTENPSESQGKDVEELQEIEVAFSVMDSEGRGKLTANNLRTVMNKFGHKCGNEDADRLIKKFDADASGTLEFNEFSEMMKMRMNGPTLWEWTKRCQSSPDTWEAFKVFDRNSDGYISKSELCQTMKELGVTLTLEDLNEMMNEADVNQDGRIDYAEFAKLMTGAFENFAKQAALIHRQSMSIQDVLKQNSLSYSDLEKAFHSVDQDQDGFIDSKELEELANSVKLNLQLKDCEEIIKKCGSPEGKMSFSSFLTLVSRSESREKKRITRHRSEEDEGMRASFKVFDIDGDGYIDAAELRQTMHDLGEPLSDRDVESMIKSADKNGDGRIDYEEFILMMHAK